MEQKRIPVIIDTDPGIDDASAIFWVLANRDKFDVKVIAIDDQNRVKLSRRAVLEERGETDCVDGGSDEEVEDVQEPRREERAERPEKREREERGERRNRGFRSERPEKGDRPERGERPERGDRRPRRRQSNNDEL